MSKTYRRTKRKTPKWVTSDLVRCDGYRWYQRIELEGKERQKAIKKYHSDAIHRQSPPSWFVNIYCTRRDRAKEKKELKCILDYAGDYEDYFFDPYKKSAYYDWW